MAQLGASKLARVSLLLAVQLQLGCEDPPEEREQKIASWAKDRVPSAQPAAASGSAPPIDPTLIVERPKSVADLALTEERKQRIDKAFVQVDHWEPVDNYEDKLFKLELKRGADDKAIAAFDRQAKGKWLLFTGNITNPTDQGFELPVRYTPRDRNDKVGLTSQWFLVKFANVKGYAPESYQAGELTAVLARYDGKAMAAEGYDLVLLRQWMKPRDQ